jgi:hypothetical protein
MNIIRKKLISTVLAVIMMLTLTPFSTALATDSSKTMVVTGKEKI